MIKKVLLLKKVLFAFFVIFSVNFICCRVGLDEEVDLEAPELSVKSLKSGDVTLESFGGGVYCKKNVTFSGTATDNNKISRVYVELKWSTENSFVEIGEANISGSNWTFNYEFKKEGSCFIRFSAEDPAKNYSAKTSKTITLFVDETAPVANAWYIDRELNGIQYNLKTKEELENLDLTLPENKDAAQNSSFTLCATANDTFGIKNISVTIKDEDGNSITTVENSNEDNNYAPKFKITEDILVKGKPELASGKHYLSVYYNAEDIVEFPSSNVSSDIEVSIGYFLWWPESDIPQIVSSDIQSDSSSGEEKLSINTYVNNTISLSFFDDDALSEGYFALLTDEESKTFTSTWDEIKKNPSIIISAVKDSDSKRAVHFKANGERETTIVLTSAETPQTMRLLALGYDNTSAKNIVTKDISVRVTDDSTPMLLITSPKNNSIPSVDSSGNITIEGQSLDKAGCTYLEFVWVPQSVSDKKSAAQSWLDTISTDSAHNALASATNRTTTKDGMKLWSVSLNDSGQNNGFYTNSFSFTVDLLNDFIIDSTNEKAEDKYFLVKLTRKDGNYVYEEYSLLKDDSAPKIVGVSPISDMQIVQEDKNYTLQFYATKDSGLEINTSKYKIEEVSSGTAKTVNGSYNSSSKCYKATISSETLSAFNKNGTQPKYRFYASDIFDNEGVAQYTLVISDLPTLQSISSSAATQYKKGDTIDIIAMFSKTVQVSSDVRLKLKGITNSKLGVSSSDVVYASYASGSGTTSLHFSYVVQDGDSSSGLTLYDNSPLDDNGTSSFTSDKVVINALSSVSGATPKNDLDSKNIKIDGIAPTGTLSVVSTNAKVVSNASTTYLKEGSVITATLKMSESVFVASPSPEITLVCASDSSKKIVLQFTNSTGSGSDTTLTFEKTITSDDANGAFSFASDYLANETSITDSFGNEMELSSAPSVSLYVDTVAPKTPTSTLTSDAKGKDSVSFTLTKAETDNTIQYLQYSEDGGKTWIDSTEGANSFPASLTKTCSFTYRAIDFAGNVSDIPDAIYVEIENNFPSFSVECLNADGNYKEGSTLTLRVSFSSAVNVPANCGATIAVSDASGSGKGGGNAVVSTGSTTTTSSSTTTTAYSVDFTYTVQSTDDFTLKIASDAVTLTGITDEYGNTQGGKTLSADYERTGIHCDGIAPTITNISEFSGTNRNQITITFSEDVIKSSGNITLQRAGDWAIPPVLSASDFNKIVNAYPAGKETLSLQESGSDMEDSEWVNASNEKDYKNQYYHGTGQFVGPYKKSTQGILDSGEPDTSTKYVLDFDMDIWETTTEHYYGKTFTSRTQTSPTTLTSSNATTITANDIRSVLKSAGYDKRVVDVTSSNVKVSGNSVTVTFPKGLCDTSDTLPSGIEWEVVFDEATFMDASGNYSSLKTSDTITSSGVATPVVRVDRYSYGLGIYQSDLSGNKTTYISGDSTKPTGFVRTRIDCETKDATINYTIKKATNGTQATIEAVNGQKATSKYTPTNAIKKTTLNSESLNLTYKKDNKVFASGNGDYKTACRQYIVAQATKNSSTSEKGYEGIFQTVVRIVEPKTYSNYSIYKNSDEWDDFSIRGTTGWSGEPYISPFPLRDAQIGSPYLRLCFKGKADTSNSSSSDYYKDYFWVSYEILVNTSFSGVTRNYSQWRYIANWGWVTVGGLSECSGMYTLGD